MKDHSYQEHIQKALDAWKNYPIHEICREVREWHTIQDLATTEEAWKQAKEVICHLNTLLTAKNKQLETYIQHTLDTQEHNHG